MTSGTLEAIAAESSAERGGGQDAIAAVQIFTSSEPQQRSEIVVIAAPMPRSQQESSDKNMDWPMPTLENQVPIKVAASNQKVEQSDDAEYGASEASFVIPETIDPIDAPAEESIDSQRVETDERAVQISAPELSLAMEAAEEHSGELIAEVHQPDEYGDNTVEIEPVDLSEEHVEVITPNNGGIDMAEVENPTPKTDSVMERVEVAEILPQIEVQGSVNYQKVEQAVGIALQLLREIPTDVSEEDFLAKQAEVKTHLIVALEWAGVKNAEEVAEAILKRIDVRKPPVGSSDEALDETVNFALSDKGTHEGLVGIAKQLKTLVTQAAHLSLLGRYALLSSGVDSIR